MPWCETCSKYWNPSSMNADGSCPTCGRVLAAPTPPPAPADATSTGADPRDASAEAPAPDVPAADADAGTGPWVTAKDLDLKELAGKDAKAPWHFKLLVVALVVYLTWRLVELIIWLAS